MQSLLKSLNGSFCDDRHNAQIAVVLQSATCVGNDGESCPLLHGSLGPKVLSKLCVDNDATLHWHMELQRFCLNSHCVTWTDEIYFGQSSPSVKRICETLASTKYSSRSLRVIRGVSPSTLSSFRDFVENHCEALESFIFGYSGGKKALGADLRFLGGEKVAQTLTHLDLSRQRQITDDTVEFIGTTLRHLRFLCLDDCKEITSAAIQFLKRDNLPFLQTLNLSCTSLKRFDNGNNNADLVAAIAALSPTITDLDLSFCGSISDAALEAIASTLIYLNKLNIAGSVDEVTDKGFIHLKKLVHLAEFYLSTELPNVTSDCMAQVFSKMSRLKYLDVEGCSSFEDKHLEVLFSSSSSLTLETLILSRLEHDITDEGCKILAKFSRLEKLELYENSAITGAGIDALFSLGLPELKVLQLGYCENITKGNSIGISSRSLFSNLPSSLIELDVQHVEGVDNAAVQNIANCCPHLVNLSLDSCVNVGDAGVVALKNMKCLRYLNLSYITKNITVASLIALSSPENLVRYSLVTLALSEARWVRDDDLKVYVTNLTSLPPAPELDRPSSALSYGLENLHLEGNRKISNEGLMMLASLKRLTNTYLSKPRCDNGEDDDDEFEEAEDDDVDDGEGPTEYDEDGIDELMKNHQGLHVSTW